MSTVYVIMRYDEALAVAMTPEAAEVEVQKGDKRYISEVPLVSEPEPEEVTMQPVTSGQIGSLGRSGEDVLVEFKNGDRYRYDAVPDDVFNDWLAALSVGQFFHAYVKPVYRCTKVEQ